MRPDDFFVSFAIKSPFGSFLNSMLLVEDFVTSPASNRSVNLFVSVIAPSLHSKSLSRKSVVDWFPVLTSRLLPCVAMVTMSLEYE